MDRHNESHGHSLNCRYKRNIIDKTRLKISNTPSELIPMVTKLVFLYSRLFAKLSPQAPTQGG